MLNQQKRTMQSFYDGVAREYVQRDTGVRQLFHNSMELGWLDELPLHGKNLLDVGAGVGRVARYVGDRAKLLIGVDLSREMVQIARERTNGFSHTWFIQSDAEFLPFARGSFDLVTCLGLFEYVANLEPFVREFFRVTAPQGYLLFTCHNLRGLGPFRNAHYSVADHAGDAVQTAVRKCGFRLTRHATIYHANGKWIWAARRLLRPIGLEAATIRCAIALNQMLQASALLRNRGKVHLVLAQRP